MMAYGKAFLGLEKAQKKADVKALLSHATNLVKYAQNASTILKPQKNAQQRQTFENHLVQLQTRATDMVTTVQKQNMPQIREGIENIRRTCVSCHVRFRNNTDDIYPAQHNIVTGDIQLVNMDGNPLKDRSNIVVFIDRVEGKISNAQSYATISQKDRTFSPKVLPIIKGTTVQFPNDDVIFHNIFSVSRANPFDLDIYSPGETRTVTFDQTGWVKVYCNIHPSMIAHILILENPYFSLTDPGGTFVISDLTDGNYTLRAWHEASDPIRQEISIQGPNSHHYTLQIRQNRKTVQHKNKHGKPYRKKY